MEVFDDVFPSRYRAAFHFRLFTSGSSSTVPREFQSRYRAAFHFRCPCGREGEGDDTQVSISLSSGFSFQAFPVRPDRRRRCQFQSRYRAAFHFRKQRFIDIAWRVIKFQSRYRAAFHFRPVRSPAYHAGHRSFNLVIERLFISGKLIDEPEERAFLRFNLVIERLFISGRVPFRYDCIEASVSISLSSGFSFQVKKSVP